MSCSAWITGYGRLSYWGPVSKKLKELQTKIWRRGASLDNCQYHMHAWTQFCNYNPNNKDEDACSGIQESHQYFRFALIKSSISSEEQTCAEFLLMALCWYETLFHEVCFA